MLGHRCSGAAGAGSDEGCWGIGAVVQQGQGVGGAGAPGAYTAKNIRCRTKHGRLFMLEPIL